ncbi:MAG: hypothetical protein J1F28_10945 [Oscillospiraceae bacterium]|nr:hypothetical protein [Oscillospiraceae bacterium]
MKKMKRFAALIVAAVSVSAVGISAYAATNQYPYYYELKTPGYGGADWSNAAEKLNNASYAEFEVENGYISSGAYAYVSVFKSPSVGNSISEEVKVDDVGPTHKTYYTVLRGAGSMNYLGANGSYYGVQFTGHWNP